MTPSIVIGVASIGGLAALGRFRLDGAVARRMSGGFPWGTLTVNLVGALLAGLAFGAGLSGGAGIVIAVGALGSFSTLSTWMLETHRMIEEGNGARATMNVVAGALGGFAAVLVGFALGGLL